MEAPVTHITAARKTLITAGLLLVWLQTTPLAAPAAPTGLAAAVSGSTVTLQWRTPAGATAIRLEAGTAPGLSDAANTVIGAVSNYVAANVPSGRYFVRVRAIDPTGESGPSNEITVQVGQLAAPPVRLFDGKIAASLTDNANAPAVVVGTDGSVLIVTATNGMPTGAVLRTPRGDVIAVTTRPDGLPSRALVNNTIVLFENYTASTVDIALIAPSGERRIIRNAQRPHNLSARQLATTARDTRLFGYSLATWWQAGTLIVSATGCIGAIYATGGTFGATAAAMLAACGSFAVQAGMVITELRNAELEASGAAMGTVGGFISCLNIVSVANCGAFFGDLVQNQVQDHFESYAGPIVTTLTELRTPGGIPTPAPGPIIPPPVGPPAPLPQPAPLTGTWTGTWNWSGPGSNGCLFNNGGAVSMTLTQAGNSFSGSISAAGLQRRSSDTCALTGVENGTGTVSGTLSGGIVNLSFSLAGSVGSLNFSGTATLSGGNLSANFRRTTGGNGSFIVQKR
jgi:hypothetical protein